jgi:hypothetical protein
MFHSQVFNISRVVAVCSWRRRALAMIGHTLRFRKYHEGRKRNGVFAGGALTRPATP